MSTVKVTHEHHLPRDELKARIGEIAEELDAQFKLQSSWQDDATVNFKRPGLSGTLTLSDDRVDVKMKLGLMLGALKDPIARELKRQMEKRLT